MTAFDTLEERYSTQNDKQSELSARLTLVEDIVGTAATMVALANTIVTKTNDVSKVSNDLVKTLKVMSKLPFGIGLVTKPVLFLYAKGHYNIEQVDDLFDEAKPKLDRLSSVLSKLALGGALAREVANEVDESVGNSQSGIAVVARGIGITPRSLLDAQFENIEARNRVLEDIASRLETVLVDTGPVFVPLEALRGTFAGTVGRLEAIDGQLDIFLRISNPLAGVLSEINKAIEPVSWALDKADEVLDEVVKPVIEAVLEATGLSSLVEQIEGLLSPIIDEIEEIRDRLIDINIALDNSIIEKAETAFDAISGAYGLEFDTDTDTWVRTGTSILDEVIDLGPIRDVTADGDVIAIGTARDDTLIGGLGDDILVGGLGNDSIDGLGGDEDIAGFTDIFTNFRVEDLGNGLIQAAPRDLGNPRQGTDLLAGIEFLLFEDPNLGLIDTSDVSRFTYTDPDGSPPVRDLTGTDDDDVLIGDSGTNGLFGGAGDDSIFGAGGNDFLGGGIGDDRIFAGDGNDVIAIGDNLPNVGERDDIQGEAGFDAIEVGSALGGVIFDMRTGVLIALGVDYAASATSIEEFQGSQDADTVIASDADDIIRGNGGDDVILGAGSGDLVFGGAGIDRITFDPNAFQGLRVDIDTPGTGTIFDLADYVAKFPGQLSNAIQTEVESVEVIEGSPFADVFKSAFRSSAPRDGDPEFTLPWAVRPDGQVGPDPFAEEVTDGDVPARGAAFTITGSAFSGGSGADLFVTGRANDAFDGGDGTDLVMFVEPGEVRFGKVRVDLQEGLAVNLNANNVSTGVDLLINIEGAIGSDTQDELLGDGEANAFYGFKGSDTLEGRGGADLLDGGNGDDILDGGAGDDLFFGQAGADALIGGTGQDTVDVTFNAPFRITANLDPEIESLLASENPGNILADGRAGTGPGTVAERGQGVDIDMESLRLVSSFGDGDIIGSVRDALAARGVVEMFEIVTAVERNDQGNLRFDLKTDFATGVENVLGTPFQDDIAGDGSNNLFDGRDGNDTLSGRDGQDVLIGGGGEDILDGGDGTDILNGGGSGREIDFFLVRPEDFEIVSNSVFTTVNEIDGWTNPGDKVEVQSSGLGQGTSRFLGQDWVDLDRSFSTGLDGIDRLQQTFTTEAGRVYELSFAMRSRWIDSQASDPNFTPFDDISQTAFVEINGQDVNSGGFQSSGNGIWTEYSLTFLGTGQDTITFLEALEGSDAFGPHLDAIGVAALGVADTLTGGEGADTFVLERAGIGDVITDFTPGEDILDLRDFKVPASSISFVDSQVSNAVELFVDTLRVAELQGLTAAQVSVDDVLVGVTALDDLGTGARIASTGATLLPDVLANDKTGLNTPLSVIEINEAPLDPGEAIKLDSGGSIYLGHDGRLIFRAETDFAGLAPGEESTRSFEYTVSDGQTEDTAAAVFTVVGAAVGADIDGTDDDDELFGTSVGEVIRDGGGSDTILGRGGADTFVMALDGAEDVIEDFDSDDTLDLSAWGVVEPSQLDIQELPDGQVAVTFGAETLILRNADTRVAADALTPDRFIFASPLQIVDTPGFNRLAGTAQADVFTMLDDGARDQIRDFDPGLDKIDVSAFAAGLEDLEIANLTRSDGSVKAIAITDRTGDLELLIVRFAGDTALDASALDAQSFVFADAPLPPLPRNLVEDLPGFNRLVATSRADIFTMLDDGARDQIRDFEPGLDKIDVSAFAAGLEDLEIANLTRSDGSVKAIAITDRTGDLELMVVRFAGDTPLDASALDTQSFVFADAPLPPLPPNLVEDTAGFDRLAATSRADIFTMLDDGARDQIRDFDPGSDKIDVSAFAAGLADLDVANLTRSDGSVKAIAISDRTGDLELMVVRFAGDTALDASLLDAQSFVFADAPLPPLPPNLVEGLPGFDRLVATSRADIFTMLDDGARDQIRDFDPDQDKIDVSAFAAGLEDLEIANLTRSDGSVKAIAITDRTGDLELMVVRFAGDTPLDASALDVESFVFDV